jgi:hypothetical protein
MGVIVALSSAHSCPLASSGTILAAFVAMQTTTGPSTAPNDSHANRSAPLGMTSMCGGRRGIPQKSFSWYCGGAMAETWRLPRSSPRMPCFSRRRAISCEIRLP